jgi:hypothetical protein
MLLLVPLPMLASMALAVSPTLPASLLLDNVDAADGVPALVGASAFEGVLALAVDLILPLRYSDFLAAFGIIFSYIFYVSGTTYSHIVLHSFQLL